MKFQNPVILIIILLLFTNCNSDLKNNISFDVKSEIGFHNLKGNVKSVLIIRYKVKQNFENMLKDKMEGNPIKYSFNKDGKIVEELEYFSDFDLYSKKVYKYDNNNYIGYSEYDSKGALETKTVIKKGNIKNEIIEEAISPDGNIIRRFNYFYDSKGKINKKIMNSYILKWIVKTKINYKNGNEVEKIYSENEDDLFRMENLKYDENGNELEVKYFDKNGELTKIETSDYEFDSKDNWTKRINYKNSVPIEIIEREIKYY